MERNHTAGLVLALLVSAGLAAGSPARAQTSQTFTGTFAHDDSLFVTGFTVAVPTDFKFYTTSYAGGTNTDNTVSARGGFDPILELFNGSGALVATNDDGGAGVVPADSVTGHTWDSFLQGQVGAGSYTLVLSQYLNVVRNGNLVFGFTKAGQHTFTSVYDNNGTTAPFVEVGGDQRDGHYALNAVSSPAPAPVPEASSAAALGLLLMLGAGGVLVRRRRRAV